MKKFKRYITEVQRYEMNPPTPDTGSGGRRTIHPYYNYPFPDAPRTRPNYQNPMMTPPWATDPYWSPGGAGEGDWRVPGLEFTDPYLGYEYSELPLWLKMLWGIWWQYEFLPGVGDIVDVSEMLELFQLWADTLGMTPEEYEQFVQQLLQYLRDHNIPVPEYIPSLMHQMFYLRLPNGTYQLMRWNPQTGQYEPFGEPIQTLPGGENAPPVYNHPDYVKPSGGLTPDFRPIHLNPNDTPYIPNIPWSPTRTPYQWSPGSENPEDPMISGMGG